MTKPVVAVTLWRRTSATFLGDATPLHTLHQEYADAIDRAGAIALLIGHMNPDDADAVLDTVDGLVITGGGDFDPATYGEPNTDSVRIDAMADARDLALARAARARQMPVLGICRGMQAINIAGGGSLRQENNGASEAHPTLAEVADERNAFRHVVEFTEGCRLSEIYGVAERKVNSLHHQAIERLGRGLTAVGLTEDGSIEAIESADSEWPVIGVQWHPEMLPEAEEHRLFAAFVADVAVYRARSAG